MKFSGRIGFLTDEEEISPGVWKPIILERAYVGDVLSNRRYFQEADKQNENLSTNNQISILSDLYAQQNWNSIRYIIWNSVKWKVTSVDVSYPRLTLTLGGVYNENAI